MNFETLHNYNRLVRRGLTKPLLCSHCEEVLTPRLGENDEPVLRCMFCQTTLTPSLAMWEDIIAVVKEHFE